MTAKKKTEGPSFERRLARLEKAMKHFSDGLWKLSNEIALNRPGKNNPERKRLERRVVDLENKFYAFQCGAQAQMERDRAAEAEERNQRIREALGPDRGIGPDGARASN